ncbi:toxin-antitoxin system HicB family antitoxin [Rhodopila globiformis]|uniref:Toxin-antitoxin system HicB family antitoxin n=1 Tax=Rhodopila globiformis TaxID=1071 RepID=A0A2S6NJC5_RHOGL|nr:toxin-antitoxin system HicB family antitoxin [Rhodopila globiformis]PPQ34910.1 hypothetical protein CCS01_09360 [Rhodopila globiformis]
MRTHDPQSPRTYSGKFIVRVLPELHRRLVIEAAEAQVSLNLLVSHRLSITTTGSGLPGAAPRPPQAPGPQRKKAEDPGTTGDAAPARGAGGGVSGKRARTRHGRKTAPAKRPKDAA